MTHIPPACECNPVGSLDDACNRATGQCSCGPNYGDRQCDQCRDGFFSYPTCESE